MRSLVHRFEGEEREGYSVGIAAVGEILGIPVAEEMENFQVPVAIGPEEIVPGGIPGGDGYWQLVVGADLFSRQVAKELPACASRWIPDRDRRGYLEMRVVWEIRRRIFPVVVE